MMEPDIFIAAFRRRTEVSLAGHHKLMRSIMAGPCVGIEMALDASRNRLARGMLGTPLRLFVFHICTVPVEMYAESSGDKELTWQAVVIRCGKNQSIPTVQKLLDQCALEEDPPLIFGWKDDAILRAMQAYQGNVPLPAFLQNINIHHVTIAQLRLAIMQHLCNGVPGLANRIVEEMVIPGPFCQIGKVLGNCATLQYDPYFIDVAAQFPAAVPLASLYLPGPGSDTVENASPPMQPPPAAHLWA
jgi:hypothetical protein